MADGEHVREETSTASLTVRVVVEPYPVAVMVTLRALPVIVKEVTVKLAEVPPAGTLTDAGTPSAAALLEILKDSAALEGPVSVIVQVSVERLDIVGVPDTVGRAQVSPESGTAGTAVRVAVFEVPP